MYIHVFTSVLWLHIYDVFFAANFRMRTIRTGSCWWCDPFNMIWFLQSKILYTFSCYAFIISYRPGWSGRMSSWLLPWCITAGWSFTPSLHPVRSRIGRIQRAPVMTNVASLMRTSWHWRQSPTVTVPLPPVWRSPMEPPQITQPVARRAGKRNEEWPCRRMMKRNHTLMRTGTIRSIINDTSLVLYESRAALASLVCFRGEDVHLRNCWSNLSTVVSNHGSFPTCWDIWRGYFCKSLHFDCLLTNHPFSLILRKSNDKVEVVRYQCLLLCDGLYVEVMEASILANALDLQKRKK